MSASDPNDEPRAAPIPVARKVAHAAGAPAGDAPRTLPPADHPLNLAPLSRFQAALDLALVCLVMLVVPFGLEFLLALTLGTDPANLEMPSSVPPYVILTAQKTFDALVAAGIAAYFLLTHRLPSASFGLDTTRLGAQVGWSIPAFITAYAAFAVTIVALTVLAGDQPLVQEDMQKRTDFLQMMPIGNLAAAVALLIPVAIHEELLFRGLLLPYLHRLGLSWWLAILVSSAVFGSLHIAQGALAVLQIVVLGVVFGAFFCVSRSLLAVTIAHFLFNFAQFQVARYVLPWLEQLPPPTTGPS